jgi:hypothetical protein
MPESSALKGGALIIMDQKGGSIVFKTHFYAVSMTRKKFATLKVTDRNRARLFTFYCIALILDSNYNN